jgi:hypothetical protein
MLIANTAAGLPKCLAIGCATALAWTALFSARAEAVPR